MTDNDRIGYSLFTLRIGIFIVMYIWTLDKLINPGHASKVFENFYFIPADLAEAFMFVIGLTELALIIAFVAGIKKCLTYGLVLVFHTVSTVSSWKIYMDPFASPNILFWAAFPMLAACFSLYALQDLDTKFTAGYFCKRWCSKESKSKTD